MIPWDEFWAWVQVDPDVARAVALYERKHPPEPDVTPEGGWPTPYEQRTRMPTTQERLRELMRHLYMRVHTKTRRPLHAGSGLDDLWHALIVETATYRAVCEMLGGGFVDHASGEFSTDPLWYAWYQRAYHDTFGEYADWNVWPTPNAREISADQAAQSQRDHDCA